MRRLTALPMAIACCLVLIQQAGAQIEWDAIYKGDVLPNKAGWGSGTGDNTSAEVTPEGLRIVDAGTQNTQLHCYSRSWGAQPDRGAIVEAIVKVVSCSGPAGMSIHVSDGVHEDGLTMYPDRIEFHGSELKYEMDTTDDFHTYQIRIAGTNVEVWVDGKLAIDGWDKFTKEAYHGRCVVQFGSISSAATGEAVFKEVRYAVNTIPVELYEKAQNVVIYRKEGVYACFPSLTRTSDGKLYTSFGTRVRRSHIDGTGGSAQAVSEDGGYTWTATDDAPPDPRNVREDGATITPRARGWIYVDEAKLPEIEEQGRTWMKAREGTIAYLGDPEVLISMPDGKTETVKLDPPNKSGVMGFHFSSSFLREGDLWMTAIYGGDGEDNATGVWALRSDDNGETWETAKIAGSGAGSKGFNETAICDNGKGEIIAVMRPVTESQESYQCFSSDGGKTWSKPEPTGFWGYPANVILLQDGRLLCTYGYRRAPMGIHAVLSDDGGHTWDVENEIILRADGQGAGGDNGYPLSKQMDDGHIFTIYYINDNESVTHIAGTNWELP